MTMNEKYPIVFLSQKPFDHAIRWIVPGYGFLSIVQWNDEGLYRVHASRTSDESVLRFFTGDPKIILEIFAKFSVYGTWQFQCEGSSQ